MTQTASWGDVCYPCLNTYDLLHGADECSEYGVDLSIYDDAVPASIHNMD
jgi:hypothetical protein